MRYYYQYKSKKISEIEKVECENRVRFYRRLREWSQDELAEKIGAKAGMIYKIEKRVVAPKITTIYKLADALGVPSEHLFFRPGENPPVHADEFC